MNKLTMPKRVRPITILAWMSFISIFVFAGLSEYYTKNFQLGGMFATIGTVMIPITFILAGITGRERP